MEDTKSILSAEFPHLSTDIIDLVMLVSNDLQDARATLMQNAISQELGTTHTSIDPPIVAPMQQAPLEVQQTPLEALLFELQSQSGATYSLALNVLRLVLRNLLEFPDQEKYRRIRLGNENFQQKVGRFPAGIKILEHVGFVQFAEDELIIFDIENSQLQEVLTLIEMKRDQLQVISAQPSAEVPPQPPAVSPPPPPSLSRREQIALANEQRLARLQSGLPAVDPAEDDNTKYRGVYNLNRGSTDLTAYRQRQRNKWIDQRPRQMTINELSALRQDIESKNVPQSKTNDHAIGIKAFELTNEFRKSQGLPPCVWNERMCEIGVVHSKNMGDGKVPFGHDGFNGRYHQFPFSSTRSGAENVAWSKGHSEVALTAVDGWIKSPGHRKNMVGDFNYSGIGVYTTPDGRTYLTQLFARA